MSLVSNLDYHVPAEVTDKLEEVCQALVTAWYDSANLIFQRQVDQVEVYGDVDYRVTKRPSGILLEALSADWWAVLDWEDRDWGQTEFSVHVSTGNPPKRIDWDKLDLHEHKKNVPVHLHEAVRDTDDTDDRTWYRPKHRIDFRWPLLHALKDVLYEEPPV